MFLLLSFLILVIVSLVLLSYWLMWKWYQCGKEDALQSFHAGNITKKDCRSDIITHRVLIAALTFVLTVTYAFGACCVFNLPYLWISYLMLGLVLFALLYFLIKFPTFLLLFGVFLFPFGGNYHPNWRHRIRRM